MNTRMPLLIAGLLFLSSCSSLMGGRPPEYKYEKDALSLYVKSDPQLNLYQKKAHTLVLCIYQMRDPNGFNQLRDEDDGLSRLLECGRVDPGVVSNKKLMIQPRREVIEVLDRAEGAKYVGLVAGYYNLDRDKVTRLVEIPLDFFNKPKPIYLELYLGQEAIEGLTGSTSKPKTFSKELMPDAQDAQKIKDAAPGELKQLPKKDTLPLRVK